MLRRHLRASRSEQHNFGICLITYDAAAYFEGMPSEWIKADLALAYVSAEPLDWSAQRRICARAFAGMIKAKADRMVIDEQEFRDQLIDREFWADGREALQEDWTAGDFSSCPDGLSEVKAFGVSFDFAAISDLVPSDRKAEALRRISSADRDQWISARELASRLQKEADVTNVEKAIVEAAQLGQISARALRAQGSFRHRSFLDWAVREWDVPLWFWRELVRPDHYQNWNLNTAHGDGTRNGEDIRIQLQGVHFHRSGLEHIGLADGGARDSSSSRASTGRRPKYDWPAATLAIFGLIHRGDLKPSSQADVERALICHLTNGDEMPSDSSVRPYAKLIWHEHNKA